MYLYNYYLYTTSSKTTIHFFPEISKYENGISTVVVVVVVLLLLLMVVVVVMVKVVNAVVVVEVVVVVVVVIVVVVAVVLVKSRNIHLRSFHQNIIDEELNELYSTNITRLIKMDGTRGTYEEDVCTSFWWRNLRERNHLQDLGVDGRALLKRIFKKQDVGRGMD
jgi:hypothetical protein